ncbi:hypothetical protein PR003_g7135 [Phytophthora rubi]|uniref:Uncharacterized protein n=1 Tax=Phytophthora rubi TaxID=129364 RepID=A0A6A3N4Q9_9STRA|nr:hypothetical protein PR002_g5898 [Phytophthora rubi]KAE9041014.1 hypothetical protein PR001_g6812 [Phytophthora rubi]KAE9347022.1 hypothetical protein PR003_g7135 [Phytophthora rubi]
MRCSSGILLLYFILKYMYCNTKIESTFSSPNYNFSFEPTATFSFCRDILTS